MSPRRPYLLRAMYEWMVDNRLTPHVLINALSEDVEVPQDYVKDGQITLNIAPDAVRSLTLGNDVIRFNARFRGIPQDISFPVGAVMGIYAREDGQGMMFEDEPETPGPQPPGPSGSKSSAKPSLRVVK